MPIQTDTTLLQMALMGYEAELQKIQEKIDEIQRRLGGRNLRVTTADAPAKLGRRRMSAAARRKIALAQKRRWAEYRKKQKAA